MRGRMTMTRSKIFAAALVAVLASGTVATEANAAGKRYCQDVAHDYAKRKTGAPQVLTGLVGGAIAGGLIGSVIGGKKAVRTGVVVGGATGAVVGAGHANEQYDRYYWRKYNECRRW
jgi:uncharacterized protein YcfJ